MIDASSDDSAEKLTDVLRGLNPSQYAILRQALDVNGSMNRRTAILPRTQEDLTQSDDEEPWNSYQEATIDDSASDIDKELDISLSPRPEAPPSPSPSTARPPFLANSLKHNAMVEIRRGTALFRSSGNCTDTNGENNTDKENSPTESSIWEEGSTKRDEQTPIGTRIRFKLSSLSSKEKPRWRRFYEAVVLDYIQKGPDQPAPDGEAGRRRIDDREITKLIKKRFLQIFCLPSDPKELTSEQLEAVSGDKLTHNNRQNNAPLISPTWAENSLLRKMDCLPTIFRRIVLAEIISTTF